MNLLEKISNKHILIIGDSILDKTVSSRAIGLSLESPTLKTQEINEEVSFGGAGNVVKNLLSLGCKCTFLTLVGNDEYRRFYDQWQDPNLHLIQVSADRRNVVKSRYWVEHGGVNYKYLQINSGDKGRLEEGTFEEMYSIYEHHLEQVDVVILVDYNNGVFADSTRAQRFIGEAKRHNIPTISSSQISDGANRYSYFKNSSYICMNESEALRNFQSFSSTDTSIVGLSHHLESSVCVTLGKNGSIFSDGERIFRAEPPVVSVKDTCGAGDAFLAAFAVCLGDMNLKFCNMWAAISTTKLGTSCSSLEDLDDFGY